MSWWTKFFGNPFATTADAIGRTAEVFVGNKADRDRAQHLDNMAVRNQYASEFQYRGQTDFVDKWNRLPRPMLVTTVLGFFPFSIYMVFNHPVEYRLLIEALALIPSGAWLLLSTIIGFYFGGRMQIKSQDFRVNQDQLSGFVDSVELYKKEREIAESTPPDAEEKLGDK